jgi:hypothetical protein
MGSGLISISPAQPDNTAITVGKSNRLNHGKAFVEKVVNVFTTQPKLKLNYKIDAAASKNDSVTIKAIKHTSEHTHE